MCVWGGGTGPYLHAARPDEGPHEVEHLAALHGVPEAGRVELCVPLLLDVKVWVSKRECVRAKTNNPPPENAQTNDDVGRTSCMCSPCTP